MMQDWCKILADMFADRHKDEVYLRIEYLYLRIECLVLRDRSIPIPGSNAYTRMECLPKDRINAYLRIKCNDYT